MAAPKPQNGNLTKRFVLKVSSQKRPTKSLILSTLNDELNVNLIRLIENKNNYIALCHSEDDAIKMNNHAGTETLKKPGLEIANTLAFEARKAIIAKNFDYWITEHSTEEILSDFNLRYPDTPCNKVITMRKNKNLLKIIFSNQQDAKTIAEKGFSIFHVRVPSYNINIDKFIEVPMCLKCYKLNDHPTRQCTSKVDICSECSVTGHRHNTCTAMNKKCINCGSNHKTTAP